MNISNKCAMTVNEMHLNLGMEACSEVWNLDFTQTEIVYEHTPQNVVMNLLT